MCSSDLEKPVVVEIGHGDGSFLAALAALKPGGRFVGFDPHGVSTSTEAVEFRPALFEPNVHLAELHPDLIISRHVLEHLTNPLGFMQEIAFAATCLRVAPQLYLEVPCIDRALEIGRTVDFYYEHNSHFTSESFERMLERCVVYITDWADAKYVPLEEGVFDLDDYIDYVVGFLEHIGPGAHAMAVCQPSVPAFAATAIMGANDHPCRPLTLTMMGGPIDTRESPTAVNDQDRKSTRLNSSH